MEDEGAVTGASDGLECSNFETFAEFSVEGTPIYFEPLGGALVAIAVAAIFATFFRKAEKIDYVGGAIFLIAGIVLLVFPYSSKIGAQLAAQEFNIEKAQGVGVNDETFFRMIAHLCEETGSREKEISSLTARIARLEAREDSDSEQPPDPAEPDRPRVSQDNSDRLAGVAVHIFYDAGQRETAKDVEGVARLAGAETSAPQPDDFVQVKLKQPPGTIRIVYLRAFENEAVMLEKTLDGYATTNGLRLVRHGASLLASGPIQIQIY